MVLFIKASFSQIEKELSMSGEMILVVDDNLINLKLARVLLSLEGYQVQTAGDANEALKILKNFRPDLILMDIQLPGMNGLELTSKIKADASLKHIEIIALTAYAMKGDEEKALAAGCNGYIAKPINTQTLPKIIAEYLKKKSKK